MQDCASVQDPDWNLIQSLYVQGVKPKEIAARTGVKADTVSARASRKGWVALTAKIKQALQGVGEYTQSESPSESKLVAASDRARAGLARLLARSVEQVETMTLKSPKHALQVNQELESVTRNCKTVFGWSDNAQAPAIRIAVLAQMTIGPASVPTPEPEPTPIIDTVTVTEVEPVEGKS